MHRLTELLVLICKIHNSTLCRVFRKGLCLGIDQEFGGGGRVSGFNNLTLQNNNCFKKPTILQMSSVAPPPIKFRERLDYVNLTAPISRGVGGLSLVTIRISAGVF